MQSTTTFWTAVGLFLPNRIDAATDTLSNPPIACRAVQMFVARHDLLGFVDHLLGTDSGVQTQIPQGTIESVYVFLEPEGAAIKRPRHVEGAVAIPPAPIAERDQDLIFGHKTAVEPGGAAIG
jgi:hypothetical protein